MAPLDQAVAIRGVPARADDPLLRRYRRVRAASLALAEPLTAEDRLAQSMPDASPTKWHLAHTAWFFETFVLAAFDPRLPGVRSGVRLSVQLLL